MPKVLEELEEPEILEELEELCDATVRWLACKQSLLCQFLAARGVAHDKDISVYTAVLTLVRRKLGKQLFTVCGQNQPQVRLVDSQMGENQSLYLSSCEPVQMTDLPPDTAKS